MPLSSGQVSLSEIQVEFGGSNPISLSEYYRGGASVPNYSLTSSIPTSGTISVGNFRSTAITPTVNGFTSTGDNGQWMQQNAVAVSPSGMFVSVGGGGNPYGASAAYSGDGINWAGMNFLPGDPSPGFFSSMQDVACRSDGLFVAVGAGNNNSLGIFSQSGDGVNFNGIQIMASGNVFSTLRSIGVNSSGLFAVGGFSGRMFHSSNGYNWSETSNSNGQASSFIDSIVCRSDGRWVGVGGNGSNRPAFSYSDNGVNWSTITNMVDLGVSTNFVNVTVSPKTGRFVAVGSYFGRYPLVAASDDGVNWSYNWGFFDRGSLAAVTCNRAGLFVACGWGRSNVDPPGFWISSTDGLNWTSPTSIQPVSSQFGSTLNGITVNNYVGTAGYGRFTPVGHSFRGDQTTYPIWCQQS